MPEDGEPGTAVTVAIARSELFGEEDSVEKVQRETRGKPRTTLRQHEENQEDARRDFYKKTEVQGACKCVGKCDAKRFVRAPPRDSTVLCCGIVRPLTSECIRTDKMVHNRHILRLLGRNPAILRRTCAGRHCDSRADRRGPCVRQREPVLGGPRALQQYGSTNSDQQ